MAVNKVLETFEEAVWNVKDGSVIMMGNFAGPGGFPYHTVKALRDQGAKELTLVANTAGGIGLTLDFDDHRILFENGQVKKVIASFPFSTSASRPSPAEKQILAGEVELEIVPQGTLAERIKAAGSGVPAFYTPTGVGTVAEEGKERRYFNGRPCLLEYALYGDYAFVRAYKADKMGNLVFRGTQRQFNPIMAMACTTTIAEVDEIVENGEIDPDAVVVPGVFVKHVVKIKEKSDFPRNLKRNFQVKKA